jgi:hypothetical protein
MKNIAKSASATNTERKYENPNLGTKDTANTVRKLIIAMIFI